MLNVKALAILLMTLAALFVAACDDDDDGGTDTASGDGETEAATTDAAATDDPATDDPVTDVTVTIEGSAFSPTEFQIAAAQDIVINLDNTDPRDHTFTVYADEGFTEAQGTGVSLPGESSDAVEGAFDAGTYFFRCEIHAGSMQGSFTAE